MVHTWRYRGLVLFCAALAVAGSACNSDPLGPGARLPEAPQREDYTNEESGEDCPPNVPPELCKPLTQAERDQMYWEVLMNVRWDVEQCTRVGERALDWVLYGDMRKYPYMSSYFTGNWTKYTNGVERIGIREDQLVTYADRMENIMHEVTHSFWGVGDASHGYALYSPQWSEQNCINW